MQVLDIYAGSKALKRIKEEGFSADLFDFMLGASGGPKWFVLAGLDRFIFADFFKGRERPVDIIGSLQGRSVLHVLRKMILSPRLTAWRIGTPKQFIQINLPPVK